MKNKGRRKERRSRSSFPKTTAGTLSEKGEIRDELSTQISMEVI